MTTISFAGAKRVPKIHCLDPADVSSTGVFATLLPFISLLGDAPGVFENRDKSVQQVTTYFVTIF